MLVLSRKLEQQILIGDNVVVTILQINGDRVRIGIEAPKNVRLLRAEIAERPARPARTMAASAGSNRQDAASHDTTTHDYGSHDHASRGLERGDAKRSAVAPRELPPSPGQQASARPARATPIQGFSTPARAGREVLGESAGLFPFLRERAMHAASRMEAPSCDLDAGQFVL